MDKEKKSSPYQKSNHNWAGIALVEIIRHAPNDDIAWRAFETSLSELDDRHQIKFLFLPDGEDPDSLVQKEGAQNFRTDGNNFVLDARFGAINNLKVLADKLEKRAGILEHGLFLSLTNKVIVAGSNGLQELT